MNVAGCILLGLGIFRIFEIDPSGFVLTWGIALTCVAIVLGGVLVNVAAADEPSKASELIARLLGFPKD